MTVALMSSRLEAFAQLFTLLIVFAIACISSSSINSYGWIWMLYGCIISIYYYGNNKCRRSE